MLTLSVKSFSFKTLPLRGSSDRAVNQGVDCSSHGGGFVFDCRALPNPGREERFKQATGLDEEVKLYLESSSEVREFVELACALVTRSIRNYLSRSFDSLSVEFGCTGGQHRSVYAAEELARFMRHSFDSSVLKVEVAHVELLHKGMI